MIPRGAAPHEGDPRKWCRIGEGPPYGPQPAAAVLTAGYEWRGTPTQPRPRRQTQTRSARSPAGPDPTARSHGRIDGLGDAEVGDVGVDPGHGTIVLNVGTAGERYSWGIRYSIGATRRWRIRPRHAHPTGICVAAGAQVARSKVAAPLSLRRTRGSLRGHGRSMVLMSDGPRFSRWGSVRRMDETNRICPWCSTPITAAEKNCPKCGAAVEGAIVTEIPGLTVVDAEAAEAGTDDPIRSDLGHDVWSGAAFGTVEEPGSIGPFTAEAEREAVEPPSEPVLHEMRKIELETEIENAGTDLMNPTGDETIPAGPPSIEAIDAYEAGLLDETGPAGEPNLGDLAAPWEDPELEQRVAKWRAVTEEAAPKEPK